MTDLATRPADDLIEQVVIQGNLASLSSVQRASYYAKVCDSLGLNPYTRPFEYITLNQRLVLYARKDATDQLRALRKVSLTITGRETVGDLYVVTARAALPDGRTDEEIGVVSIVGLKGEALANAYMKASTKAKRRVTLSICGLGLLDETEVETIPGARVVDDEPAPIGRSGRQALEAGPTVRQREIAAEMDAALAEADALLAEPIEQTAFEQEQKPAQTGELPGPRWAKGPLGQEVSELWDRLTVANDERTARGQHPIRHLAPADNATDDEVRRWLNAKAGALAAMQRTS